MKTTPLLSIALTVQQHDDGHYYWALIESHDRSLDFELLIESSQGFSTYAEALNHGFNVMRRLPEDAAVGPRDATLVRMTPEEPAAPWSQWDSI